MINQEDYDFVENELRMHLWFDHGCDNIPYGDDGEMQCCMLDFKRTPIRELVDWRLTIIAFAFFKMIQN